MIRKELLIVFVKAPRLGFVKTRLAEALGAVEACAIYRQLVDQLLGQLQRLKNVELCFSPDDAAEEIRPWLSPGWAMAPQGEGDLGERMSRAVNRVFAGQARRIVIIGSDCPGVTEADIRAAWKALTDRDVVLGPAKDGGYWLIGLRSAGPDLFHGIPWSTDSVLTATQERARAVGLSVQLLRELSDIDTVEDWRRFVRSAEREQPMTKRD